MTDNGLLAGILYEEDLFGEEISNVIEVELVGCWEGTGDALIDGLSVCVITVVGERV
jgi:hypothetical protein